MGGVVVAAAIVRSGTVLTAQRAHPAELAGHWELPGGRVEDGESETDALRRECAEELRCDVRVGDRLGPDIELPGGKVLRAYVAALLEPTGEPVAVEHKDFRWVAADELDSLDWLPADAALIPALDAALLE